MKLTWAQKVSCDNVHENHLQQKKISLGFTLQHKLGIEKKTTTKSVNKKLFYDYTVSLSLIIIIINPNVHCKAAL